MNTTPRTAEPRTTLPTPVSLAAAWSKAFLLIAIAVAVILVVVVQLRIIVIPVLVALILAALLVPFSEWLQRHRWPKWAAVTVSEVGVIGVSGGLAALVIWQLRAGLPALRTAIVHQLDQVSAWLHEPPISLTDADITGALTSAVNALQDNAQSLITGALNAGSVIGTLLAGALLVLFTTLFVLIDGRGIFAWTVRLFPRRAREAARGAGRAGWATLTAFARVQILVALVDAIGIGVGAFIIGLFFDGFPFLVPIVIAVFLGSFVPIIGAIASGVLAVVVALVFLGPVPAVIMLAVVLIVQQVEGHVLQPLIMGAAVNVHPLAVVLAVAAGGFLAGIPGTLFAVPLVAVANSIAHHLARAPWRPRASEVRPEDLTSSLSRPPAM
ncbi:AI-2E family transporter [Curtobacterium sp. L1-20]|uniref:AI-2E family transporter n=1 Tax=Curtobacterium sp. L1-20 TaxID=3138181 RepID=UPI003B523C05